MKKNIGITRKSFLIGSMAVAAAGARRMFATPSGTVCGTPRLKLAVLSDIHVRNESSQNDFIKALEWYREQNVDAVLLAGDMADRGLVHQLQLVADAWFKVFPDNKMPDGRPLVQLLEYGNHDVAGWEEKNYPDPAERARNMIKYDPKGFWERAFHETYTPIFSKTVKGYTFVGAHWPGIGGLGDWLAANGGKLDPSLPFFYFQHSHPKDTCYGPWAWGHDDGASTKALSPYANAIAFSGHSHYTLTDERSIWQGAFTSIGTSSLSYTSLDYNFRENAWGNDFGRQEKRQRQMERISTQDGKQGMLLTICDDHIRIERREFTWGESLGDDWILPIGKAAEKPYTYAKRIPVRTAPEFPKEAAVKVALVPPKAEKDKPASKEPTQVAVSFPAAEMRGKCRVFEYEVQAVVVEDDVELVAATRRALAPDFYLPLSKAGKEGACIFALAELPKGVHIRFDVTPIECFGRKGRPIRSDATFMV